MVCRMTWSKVKVTSPSNFEFLPFSTSISSAIYNGSWQMTIDSETTAQYLNFCQAGFLIFVLVFVSRDFELGRNDSCDCPNFFKTNLKEIWCVGRGQWEMHNGMSYDQIQGQGQGHDPKSPLKRSRPSVPMRLIFTLCLCWCSTRPFKWLLFV